MRDHRKPQHSYFYTISIWAKMYMDKSKDNYMLPYTRTNGCIGSVPVDRASFRNNENLSLFIEYKLSSSNWGSFVSENIIINILFSTWIILRSPHTSSMCLCNDHDLALRKHTLKQIVRVYLFFKTKKLQRTGQDICLKDMKMNTTKSIFS